MSSARYAFSQGKRIGIILTRIKNEKRFAAGYDCYQKKSSSFNLIKVCTNKGTTITTVGVFNNAGYYLMETHGYVTVLRSFDETKQNQGFSSYSINVCNIERPLPSSPPLRIILRGWFTWRVSKWIFEDGEILLLQFHHE